MNGTQYKLRCSEVLRDALKRAGADAVRATLEEKFLSEEQRNGLCVEVPPAIVEAVRRFGPQKAVEMMFPLKSVATGAVVATPAPPEPVEEVGGDQVGANAPSVLEEAEEVLPEHKDEPEETPSERKKREYLERLWGDKLKKP